MIKNILGVLCALCLLTPAAWADTGDKYRNGAFTINDIGDDFDAVEDRVTTLEAHPTGWATLTETFTYASATTITIATGGTSRFEIGDKIRFKQGGGYKYYYVVGVAATTLTVTGGSDYTVANSAITDVGLSRAASPIDFPEVFNWSPTLTGFSANPSGGVYQFRLDGVACTVFIRQPNNGTSNATTFTITTPITAKTLTDAVWTSYGVVVDNSGSATRGRMEVISAGTTMSIYTLDGSAFTASGGKRLVVGQLTYLVN